jgi:hypothetical protein
MARLSRKADEAQRPHRGKRVILTVGRPLPVYPYQQTSSAQAPESLGDCGRSLPTLRLSKLRRAWALVTFGQFPAPIL